MTHVKYDPSAAHTRLVLKKREALIIGVRLIWMAVAGAVLRRPGIDLELYR